MKIYQKLVATLLISLVAFTGCKKDDEDDSISYELGDIVCKIDGVQKKFSLGGSSSSVQSNVNHYDDNYFASPTGKVIQVGRVDEAFSVLTIDIFKDLDQIKAPQTYNIEPLDYENFFEDEENEEDLMYLNGKEAMISFVNFTNYSTYMSWHPKGNASITITSTANDIIEGSFEGWLYASNVDMDFNMDFDDDFEPEVDSVHVTEGKFKIQLVRESIIPYYN